MRLGSLNLPHDTLVRAYTQHYLNTQSGSGILPGFEGTLYQEGNGLGDIFRSVIRAIFPILSSGANTFIRGAAEGITQGKSFGQAALGAVGPAISDVIGQSVNRVLQKGSGRRRKRRSKRKVYKRKRKATSKKPKKRHQKRRRFSIAPINL